MRVERDVQTVRGGQGIKQTHEVAFFLTSLWPQEAGPARLLELIREHWSIENGQFFRRDRTQDEDRCTLSDPTAARHLCFGREPEGRGGEPSTSPWLALSATKWPPGTLSVAVREGDG